MTRIRQVVIVAALGLGVLVGCGDGDSDEASSPDGLALSLETCGEVEYGGDGTPAALIASDLPMRGDSAERSSQQVQAIRLALEQNDWTAGETPVAFQACDDSIAKTGLWDPATCRSNAEAYAADEGVLGVIGTYNSGCAAEEVPILNRAKLAMISPGNTAVCLTEESPLCEAGQPNSLYPSGERNYARVVPNDAFQGAALAEFADQRGVAHPFVLYAADDPTSTGQAESFRGAAEALGLGLAGYESWDPEADGYEPLFDQVRRSGADGVVLAGLIEQNGPELIREKVKALGPNRAVPLIAFDGFAQQATIDDAGRASAGMFASVPGSTPDNLSPEGIAFADELKTDLDGAELEQFAPYAGEAAAVLLDAIAEAGPDRAQVTEAVLTTRGGGGILKDYDIGPSGDPSVGPVTILEASSAFEPDREVTAPERLVRAARG